MPQQFSRIFAIQRIKVQNKNVEILYYGLRKTSFGYSGICNIWLQIDKKQVNILHHSPSKSDYLIMTHF